jgi:membrane protease YdiL (CAAX protease family)
LTAPVPAPSSAAAFAAAPSPAFAAPPPSAEWSPPAVNRFGLPETAPVVPPAAVLPSAPATAAPFTGGRALGLTAVAIGIGAVGMGVSWLLGRDESLEPATYIRYAIVLTLGVYAVVAALLVTRIAPGVRLRWEVGHPAGAVLFGAAVGGGLGGLLLAVVSGAAGHLSPDPRIVVMMSEGDVAHIAAALLIACVCAPLVEEVLFRGVLLESLRGGQGAKGAIFASGAAFSIWHLDPSALRYYVLMGALLGLLYVKRGLICSISAHVAFNGVLAVAAMAVVLAPAHVISSGDLSVTAPGGWRNAADADTDVPLSGLVLEGPSGAMFAVAEVPVPGGASLAGMTDRVQSGMLDTGVPGLEIRGGGARRLALPVGDAVRVDITAMGHSGSVVFVARPDGALEVVFLSGGSLKAQEDFERMLTSLRAG